MTEDLEGNNDMLTKEQYLADPCKAASIPYWKVKFVTVPDGMKILHQDEYDDAENQHFVDEPYFRLIHNLKGLAEPVLPQGYSLCTATLSEYAAHISSCYEGIGITEEELRNYTLRPVYDAALWIAVKEADTGTIVATGIAELDREIGEGVLEWIQVSQNHRGQGLGSYIISELLWRMKGKAGFATVSGQCNNVTNPEKLYRKCGFTGSDVWHILRKRKHMIIYEQLSRKNIDQYILYLKKALSEEPDMLWVEHADETGIKARINDPFYQNTKSILALDGDDVVGRIEYHFYGCLQDGYRMAYVDWVYVLPAYRHKGIAQQLFKEFEKDCVTNKIDQYYLIRSTEADADKFYHSFEKVDLSSEPMLRKNLVDN